ncbi:hypothetical protein QF027_007337 [Streptomyces canus]|nr:hypothetical protein [Streptomyces canus]
MPTTHRAAAPKAALTRMCPSAYRTRVIEPAASPKATPVPANAPISTRSLPAVGMSCR